MPDIDADIQRRVLADGSVVCRARKYARVEELPGTDKKRVVTAVHQCQQTDATPEFSESFPDLTGRHEGDDWLLSINQAGLYLEAWLSNRPIAATPGANRKLYRCAAETLGLVEIALERVPATPVGTGAT